MDGRDLARMLVEARPGLRVLYMSGYSENAIVRNGALDSDVPFLQKPFSSESLAEKVREVLGNNAARGGPEAAGG